MFPLVETIKIIDGVPMNLHWHQWRFEKSFFLHYLKPAPFQLHTLIDVPQEYKSGIVKLRFLYNESDCFCQFSTYSPKKVERLKLIVADDIEYSLKYVDRKAIEDLVARKGEADDIIIIKKNRITDTSFTNIVLNDGEKWVTPIYPLLKGTAREALLSQGKIEERDIYVEDLTNYKSIKLINAMLDFESQKEISIKKIIY